jgi:tripartite motif-containing protein 71
MSRCNICTEKAYINPCAHCDKKCCDDCREAHCDILKREISRVNNQVKRGWHRLEDSIQQVHQNHQYLSRVVHNYVVERGWSGANEHYTQ